MTSFRQVLEDSRQVSVRGFELRVCLEGKGDPLLLLNGLNRPLESWEPFTQALSGRTIVRFDAPGVGGSPAPLVPPTIATMAEIVALMLDDLGLAQVDVLGFSLGGTVAQQFAACFPKRVRRLVLVSTSCGVGATPNSWRALRRLRIPSDTCSWSDGFGALWQSMAVSSWSSIPFLGSISAKTLVVCGADDNVVPPANGRALAGRIPDASLVMVEDGHDQQCPEPARVLARVVEEFLSQLPISDEEHDHDRPEL